MALRITSLATMTSMKAASALVHTAPRGVSSPRSSSIANHSGAVTTNQTP